MNNILNALQSAKKTYNVIIIIGEVTQKDNLSTGEYLDYVKRTRDELLLQTDWVIAKYKELNENIPSNYLTYRQKLRDIPQDFTNPEDVVFPELEVL